MEDPLTEDAAVDAGDEPDNKDPDAAKGGSGGSGGSGGNQATSNAKSCGDLKCAEPATCKEADGKARCSCPSGYDDVKGDGSECKDKDECAKDSDNDCAAKASCENKPGGYECKCKAPAYEGDGKSCKCAEGFVEKNGECRAPDGGKCGDDLDCENEHCESGICCAVACSDPGEVCHTTKGATCEDGKTCKYPVSPDGETCEDTDACLTGSTCQAGQCKTGSTPVNCDDGNACTDDSCDSTLGCRNQNNTSTCDDNNACTRNDRCTNGVCGSTDVVNCSAQNDACNDGVCDPANGSCGKRPVADGKVCNDSNTCTEMDQCNGGQCKGQGNACGPNANSCTPGTPNDCSCKADFVDSAGMCVPTTNECDGNPCNANATCFDPSNNANDVTCKCKAGYDGDGKTCTAVNACAGNPCGEGRGTCTPGTGGTYTCACAAGYKAVKGQCVCDVSGTFVQRSEFNTTWTNLENLEDGSDTSYQWAIERHEYDADGNLMIETVACGESPLDLCGSGNPLIGPEAYAQFIPTNVYGTPSMGVATQTVALPNAIPNQAFETPMRAFLVGISLTDPMGAWPATRQNVAGGPDSSGTPTNGARWLDADDDSSVGLTTYQVGPGGISATGSGPRPAQSFGATSAACPRSNPNAPRLAYNYPPALEGALTVRRIKRIYSANRVINAYRGKIDSCDSMSGDIIGPYADRHIRIDGVVGGCLRVDGSGEAACSAGLVDFFQSGENGQDLPAGKFVIKRAPDTITCEGARNFAY